MNVYLFFDMDTPIDIENVDIENDFSYKETVGNVAFVALGA